MSFLWLLTGFLQNSVYGNIVYWCIKLTYALHTCISNQHFWKKWSMPCTEVRFPCVDSWNEIFTDIVNAKTVSSYLFYQSYSFCNCQNNESICFSMYTPLIFSRVAFSLSWVNIWSPSLSSWLCQPTRQFLGHSSWQKWCSRVGFLVAS